MAEKDVQVARNGGRGGGGELIRAMPERKHSFFFMEVFPYTVFIEIPYTQTNLQNF